MFSPCMGAAPKQYEIHILDPLPHAPLRPFFLVLTLNSSAIKADSVQRWLGLGSMYSKGCLATRWDAGQAFLHEGESNGGTYPDCTVHSMQEVGPATTTKVNTCNVRTYGTCRSGENRKLRVQNLQTHTFGLWVSDSWGFTSGVS